MIEIIKKIDLFSHLNDEKIIKFIKSTQINVSYIEKGYYLLHEGDIYNSLYISIDGICTVEMGDMSGKVIKIDEFKSPHIIGIGFIFNENNILPVSIKAKTNLRIIKIKKTAIFNLCKTDEIFLKKILYTLSTRIEFLTHRIHFLNFNTIREKLANYLLILANGKEKYITIPLKMYELADYFGVTRPSLSQVFINFSDEGIIIKNKNNIIIKDKKKLLRILEK